MANPSLTQEIPLIERAYTQFLKRLFLGAAGDAKQTIIDNRNYNTRQLLNSISGGAENNAGLITGSFGANTKYARSVEMGGNRIFPYRAALAWATEKQRLGHISGVKSISSFAYFVSKKVETVGTKPHPYLAPAYESLLKKFDLETPLKYDAGIR